MDYEIDAELEPPDVGEGDFWREAFRWADEGALVPDGSLAPSDSSPEVPGPLQALQGLNPDQRAAAEHVFGPAKVTAGAGAGKTKTLVARVVNLTWNHDVDPAQICLITFTCRAAGEIRARVAASVGARANAMAAGTFHSVALAIIRDDVRRFGRKGNPSIWDEDTTARELRRICEAVTGHSKGGGTGQKQWTPETLMAKLSAHKEAAKPWPSPEFEAGLVSEYDAQALEVLLEYESAKQVSNAFDYDDLIHKVVRMAEEDEEFGEKLAARWDFVMVDEYQDTNALQDRFIGLLAKRSRNLMIVGDDDQAIYGWRGSNVSFILEFESRWEGCKSHHLGQNYRSTPEVVAVADGIVSRSKQRQMKRIWTENPSGLPVMLMKAKNHEDEAFQIGAQICARISAGAKARDCAVLVRTRHQLLVLEKHLTGLGLRSQVVGLTAWWRREDSKHVLSWLKILSNPLDINAAHSVLARSAGVGPKTVSDWRDLARVTQGELLSVPLKAMMQTKEYRVGLKRGEAISAVVERHGRYQKLLQDGALMLDLVAQIYADSGIDALLQSMRSNEDAKKVDEGAAREDFRERMLEFSMEIEDLGYEGALVFLDTIYTQSADTEVGPSGRVLLTTIHSAKGLEWEHVWIAGFVQGLLPHGRIDDYGNVDVEFSNLEEERRLAYVAVTRARSTLMLSRVERTLSANKVPVPAFKSTFWLDAEEVFEAAKGPKPKSAVICLSQVSRRQAPRKAPQQEEIKPASSLCLRDILQRRRR